MGLEHVNRAIETLERQISSNRVREFGELMKRWFRERNTSIGDAEIELQFAQIICICETFV